MTRSRNIIRDAHVKVPPSVFRVRCMYMWHGSGVHWLCWLLLAVCIDCLLAEAEMADPYCYWDASFPSRSFGVYGQYVNNYYGHPPVTSFSMGESPVAAAQSTDTTCGEEEVTVGPFPTHCCQLAYYVHLLDVIIDEPSELAASAKGSLTQ